MIINPYIFGGGGPVLSFVSGLHMDGSDGSTTFTDQAGKTWTAFGDAQIDTAESKFGGASGLFDGTGDYITTPDNSDFELGPSDFTIEGWFRAAGYPNNDAGSYTSSMISKDKAGDRGFYFYLDGTSSSFTGIGFVAFSDNSTFGIAVSSSTIALNTWYHVAVCRNGSDLRIFLDGVTQYTSGVWSTTVQDTTGPLTMGAQNYDATYKGEYNGHLDDWRLTRSALYTGDFTPPASAFPNT